MKNTEIRALSTEELEIKVKEEKQNLQRLKFAHAISPLENPMVLRASRRAVARIKTELSARKLADKNA